MIVTPILAAMGLVVATFIVVSIARRYLAFPRSVALVGALGLMTVAGGRLGLGWELVLGAYAALVVVSLAFAGGA